jgi:hypothetical protein
MLLAVTHRRGGESGVAEQDLSLGSLQQGLWLMAVLRSEWMPMPR